MKAPQKDAPGVLYKTLQYAQGVIYRWFNDVSSQVRTMGRYGAAAALGSGLRGFGWMHCFARPPPPPSLVRDVPKLYSFV
jgi:hypothetical protein